MNDDLRRRATRSIGWVVIERWSYRLVNLIVFVVLSRLIAPAGFGLVALATIFTALLQVFVDSGFSKSLIQRRTLAPKDASTAFWTGIVIAVLLYGVIFLVSPALASAVNEPRLTSVLRVLCLALPLNALSLTPAALLEREFGFKALSIRQLVGVLAGSSAAVVLALSGAGVWALVAQTVVTSAVSVLVLWAATSWRPKFEFSTTSLRDLASVGMSILGIDLLSVVQANIDKLLIGAVFSAEQLGYYFLAERIGTILVELLTSVIARVSLTTFSRVQDDLPRLTRVLNQLTFAAAAVGIPIFALTAVLAPQIVPFVFGAGWEQSVPLLWILAPAWAFTTVMYFDRSVLLATGHARAALSVALLQNWTAVLLVFVLLPFGIAAVAFSRWALLITWPLRLAYLRKFVGLRIGQYIVQPARCVIAILPVVVGIALLQGTGWAEAAEPFWSFAVPLGVAGGILYAGLLWLVAGHSNRAMLKRIASGASARISRR